MSQALSFTEQNSTGPRIVFGRAPIIRRLAELAATLTRIPMSELCGRARYRDVAYARFAVMLVAHEKGKTLNQIGMALGGRHHSTVMDGLAAAARLEASDAGFAELMRRLREEAGR